MNTFSLILKNMRQRALSSVLTMLSVTLGVALAIAVIIVHREGDKLFVQSDFGYNLIVGPKGDELRLVLNSSYGLGAAQSSIYWGVYDDLFRNQRQFVRSAVPFLVGDTWRGKRIIATSNRIVNSPELEAFRSAVRTTGEAVRTLRRPSDTEEVTQDAMDAYRAKVPPAIDELAEQIQSLRNMGDGLDEELLIRLKELGESVGRARKLIDPARPAMIDAAAMIASDAVDQVRLLDTFATPFEYRVGRGFELAQGRAFHARKFEGVIGSEVADSLKMALNDEFHLEHGGDQEDVHSETWKVVGILKRTGTAMDDAIFIPLSSGWAVPAHSDAMEEMAKLGLSQEEIEKIKSDYEKAGEAVDHDSDAHNHATQPADLHDLHADEHAHGHGYHMDGDRIHLELPEALRKISGIFVVARGGIGTQTLQFRFRNLPEGMAVSPVDQMRLFFNTFMKGPTYIVLGLAILVTAVAAVSILVSIYNAVSARRREIAILRALGATRGKVLALICLEAMFVGLIGAVLGLVLGHLIAAIGASYLEQAFGQQLAYMTVSGSELLYVLGVILLAGVAGLVPAAQAYRTSVATNLAGE